MPITADQWIEVLKDTQRTLAKRIANLGEVNDAKSLQQIASLGASHFDSSQMLAKRLWRAGKRTAVEELTTAVASGLRLVTICSSADMAAFNFSFGPIAYAEFLVEGRVSPDVLDRLPVNMRARKSIVTPPSKWNIADAFLVRAILGETPKGWARARLAIGKLARKDLFVRSFDNYMEAADAVQSRNQTSVLEGILRGDELFRERKDDKFVDFSNEEGASTFNASVVDLRLAAILKAAQAVGAIAPGASNSIHLWKW